MDKSIIFEKKTKKGFWTIKEEYVPVLVIFGMLIMSCIGLFVGVLSGAENGANIGASAGIVFYVAFVTLWGFCLILLNEILGVTSPADTNQLIPGIVGFIVTGTIFLPLLFASYAFIISLIVAGAWSLYFIAALVLLKHMYATRQDRFVAFCITGVMATVLYVVFTYVFAVQLILL